MPAHFGRMMEDWQNAIVTKLKDYTGFELDLGASYLAVACDNSDSFEVYMFRSGSEFTVGFDGWHEHFTSEDEALNCFAFGLSQDCRLKVVTRGSKECRWTLQFLEDGAWKDDTETGLMFVPFWKKAKIAYRRNEIRKKRAE